MEEKFYYIVNPAGAIHTVDYEHAKARLRQPGFRTATDAEVAELKKRGGNQVWDQPICKKWSPEPEEQELSEPQKAEKPKGE